MLNHLLVATDRMGEIASNQPMYSYRKNKEKITTRILQLVDQFTSLQNETFNGTKLFKTNFSDEKTEFLNP